MKIYPPLLPPDSNLNLTHRIPKQTGKGDSARRTKHLWDSPGVADQRTKATKLAPVNAARRKKQENTLIVELRGAFNNAKKPCGGLRSRIPPSVLAASHCPPVRLIANLWVKFRTVTEGVFPLLYQLCKASYYPLFHPTAPQPACAEKNRPEDKIHAHSDPDRDWAQAQGKSHEKSGAYPDGPHGTSRHNHDIAGVARGFQRVGKDKGKAPEQSGRNTVDQ